MDREQFDKTTDDEMRALYARCAAVGGFILDNIQRCFINEDGAIDSAAVITTLQMVWARYAAAVTDDSAEDYWNGCLETTKELFIGEFEKARGFIAAHEARHAEPPVS